MSTPSGSSADTGPGQPDPGQQQDDTTPDSSYSMVSTTGEDGPQSFATEYGGEYYIHHRTGFTEWGDTGSLAEEYQQKKFDPNQFFGRRDETGTGSDDTTEGSSFSQDKEDEDKEDDFKSDSDEEPLERKPKEVES
ncbi:hypothetical protein H7H78_17125, partial [Mycobacterium shinjukuense]